MAKKAAKNKPPARGTARLAHATGAAPVVQVEKGKRYVMVVTYHQTRNTFFPVGGYIRDIDNLQPPRQVHIMPGVNFVESPADVSELLKSKAFLAAAKACELQRTKGRALMGIEYKLYEAPEGLEDGAAAQAAGEDEGERNEEVVANAFEKVPTREMIDLVARCINVRRLELIQKVETRAPVQAAIQKRIDRLRNDASAARAASASDEDEEV